MLENQWQHLLGQISQLKYFMGFNLFEIATMTAEEREFYLDWFTKIKKEENKSKQSSAPSDSGPKLGPAI